MKPQYHKNGNYVTVMYFIDALGVNLSACSIWPFLAVCGAYEWTQVRYDYDASSYQWGTRFSYCSHVVLVTTFLQGCTSNNANMSTIHVRGSLKHFRIIFICFISVKVKSLFLSKMSRKDAV